MKLEHVWMTNHKLYFLDALQFVQRWRCSKHPVLKLNKHVRRSYWLFDYTIVALVQLISNVRWSAWLKIWCLFLHSWYYHQLMILMNSNRFLLQMYFQLHFCHFYHFHLLYVFGSISMRQYKYFFLLLERNNFFWMISKKNLKRTELCHRRL